jgi:plastocyanin
MAASVPCLLAGSTNRGDPLKIVLLAALCAALVAPAALAKPQSTTLTGTVGPGFTITLKQGSKAVKSLKAGTYVFKISDKSNIHNFHLSGPGVNKKTTVGGTGSSTWKLKLKEGTYKFVCDPHASIMKGSFKVT